MTRENENDEKVGGCSWKSFDFVVVVVSLPPRVYVAPRRACGATA